MESGLFLIPINSKQNQQAFEYGNANDSSAGSARQSAKDKQSEDENILNDVDVVLPIENTLKN
jgi:hypothetical protein